MTESKAAKTIIRLIATVATPKIYLIGIMISGLVEGLKIKMIRKDGLSFCPKGHHAKKN